MISNKVISSLRLGSLTSLVRCTQIHQILPRYISNSVPRWSSEPAAVPTPEGEKKVYAANIENIASEISRLSLLEVADLNALLKEKLNIPDAAPVAAMMPGMMAAPQEEEEEVEVVKEVQTSFAVKLLSFEDSKKMGLIRFIKENMEGFNLVQSKKFLEALPAQVKSDLGKDEADKLKAELIALGAQAEVE